MAKHGMYLGEINLLGLNEFGQNPGLHPLFGTLIGGGVASLTSMVTARTTKAASRDTYGFLAGLAAAGAMYAMPKTRHAALGAALGAVLASGLKWLEGVTTGGMGMAQINYLNGLGMPEVSYLNGFGIPTISDQPEAVGTIPGVAGMSFAGTQIGEGVPLNLLGASTPQSEKVSLMGGPAVHGLSASYGATFLGGGRG
jgi:hypothetical protein